MSNIIKSKKYYQMKFDLRQLRQSRKYGPVPHALDIRLVSPEQIKWISKTPSSAKWSKAGLIQSGDWDQSDQKFCDYDLYKAIRERYKEGVEWKETEFYQRVVQEINDGQIKWGCSTISEFDSRCADLDDLYESIIANGYMSKKSLMEKGNDLPSTDEFAAIGDSCLYEFDEVAVDIGRDGSLLFVDGRNRLAICKVQGIDEIPVRIVKRHKQWQEYRNKVATENINVDTHPDLTDLEY